MRYRIHYELADGSADSVVVTGDTIDEIRQRAGEELTTRGGVNPWSEEIA